MGTYISSKGEAKDTSEMPYTYLKNALNKAIDNGDQDNIDVLQAEIDSRPDPETDNSSIDDTTNDTDVENTPDEDQ